MILVTLGTQDKDFTRLLDAIQLQIKKGKIKDKVVVQAGTTKYQTKDMEIFDLIPIDDFKKLVKECDLLITHGGVGSIIAGLDNNKVVIAAPRLKKYGEHVNDHQLEIINEFVKRKHILVLNDFNQLDKLLEKAKNFKPKEYKSNTQKMIDLIKSLII
jgi:UDP-N-acetylglucosamine transferase subunit ALG13